jgi:hypothetical protein
MRNQFLDVADEKKKQCATAPHCFFAEWAPSKGMKSALPSWWM